jgi:hypothetical protein
MVDGNRIRSRPKNLKIPVATSNRSRSRKKFRSRPITDHDPENFSGRDLEIFWKIYQDLQLDESNIEFSIGSRTKKFQPSRLVSVAPVFGSRSDIFFGSRPIIGYDPENILSRDLDRVEVPNTTIK